MPSIPGLRAPSSLVRLVSRGVVAGVVAVATLAGATAGPTPPVSAATRCPTGPEVSRWQHPSGHAINWGKVAAACNTFAVVKATEGDWYTNAYFAADWRGARAAGLYRGAYHYARPALPFSTAVRQADHFAEVVGSVGHVGDLPPVLDLEEDGGLTRASLITWAQVFLAEVQRRTGRAPVIYTYRYFWIDEMANTHALARYPLWIADYTTGVAEPHTPLIGSWPTWRLWQFTASASIPGIPGPVDKNRFNGTLDQLARFADGVHPRPLAVRRPAPPQYATAYRDGRTVQVTWLPNDNGGKVLTRNTVVASPGGVTVKVGGRSHTATFTGLPLGRTYRFTVRATNTAGLTSDPSAPSNAVTPRVPVALTVSGDRNLRYGDRTTLTAKLRRADTGAALGSRTVSVYRRPAGSASWSLWQRLTTSDTGTVRVRMHPYRNVGVRFVFAGTSAYAGDVATRSVVVRPIVSVSLSSTTTRVGGSVRMTGTVKPVLAGRTLYRQGYYSGGWHTWATTTVSRTGHYAFTIRPTVKATNVYRVLLPGSSRYGRAVSRTVHLQVS